MPTYQVDVGDKTYEVDAPDPNTAWQWANYTHAQPAPKTAGFSLKDLGLSFGQGAVGSTESITNVAGAGNAASQYLNDLNDSLGKKYTPERQAELLRQQERMKKAEESGSTLEELKAGLQNIIEAPLQSVAQGVGSFVPYIPAIFGGPIAAALGIGERAAVAANLVIKAYTPVIGTAQGAGSVKGAIYDAVYKAEIEDKVPEAEARQKADAAQEYTGQNLDQIALGAGLGYIASKGGIEKYFTKEGREHAGQALLPRVGTAVAEESVTEGAQGGQEHLASNLALQRTGRDVPTFQGVAGQAFQEGLIGGLTAGPIAAIHGGKSKADVEQERLKKEQDQFAEQEKAFIAQQSKTRENLQVPEMLALPPPSPRIEPVKEEKALTNPLGNITKNELGPEVSGYVEQYRQQNNLPPLQSYSIEDVRDAMTQVNPEGEKGALNSILTAKTGFSGEEKYTPQDVVNAAIEKNVAHETVGFQDFLQRTTGDRDLSTMSQPQLYSAFKSLSEMKRENDQQIVLPEGSNASRFTQDQYDKGRSYVTQQLATGEPLAASPAREALKDITGLKTDRDVHTLLQTVIKNEDLNVFKVGDDFQITPSTPTKDARAPLPKGYSIEEGTYAEGERPAGFEITPEGRGKPLTTVDLEEEVAPKIERLTGLRQQEAAKMLADVNKYSGVVKAGQTSLDSMEARGLTGTEAYAKEKANQARREDVLSKRIATLMKRIEEMSAPLKSKPVGTKPIITKKSTLIKDGKVLGTFPSRLDAEASMLTQLTDAELNTLATDTRFGGITDRAVQEQERRKAPPGMRVKGTEAGLAKAGVYRQSSPEMAELEKNLVAALSKFGLKDVALKVVRAINNNAAGSYEAKLIKIAFDLDNPISTMRHEALHALKELGFFTKDQWRILENKAKNDWVQTYLKNKMVEVDGQRMTRYDAYANGVKDENGKTILEPLSQAEILEEAIADAFADFDVNKAPPGMMMALLNKFRNFFKAIRQALTGAGFESAEDIFGKIEEGKLESQMTEVGGETMGKRLSLLRAANPDEVEISTQNPQGKNRIYDPITEMLSIDSAAVREAMKANPDLGKRTIQAIKAYGFVPKKTPSHKVLEVFKQNIVNNLLFLYKRVPESIRQRSKLWYDGANKIATEMADNFDVSMQQVAGIMAAMSPQKDWFQNVSMAERALDILTNLENAAWDDNMLKYANSYVKESTDRKEREKRQDAFEKIKAVAAKGTKLKDMGVKEAAAFIRAYDEAYHSRNYRIVTPEGGFGDLVRNLDGNPATMMWSTYGPIEKTVNIFRDGSRANISQQLGFEHKIRSFYNNIAAPNSDISHVTIDTHAVAAGLFEALAGTDKEVSDNFGGTGSSDVLGVGGTYGLIADAYREAAASVGIRAREMQSITWEAVRGLFSEEIKSSIKPKVRAEWALYKEGKQSFDETREKVIDVAGGFTDPDWVGSGVGTSVAEGGASYDKSFVPEGGVRLREEKDIREKLTFNLSAVTNSIPGLRELYQRAMGKDKEAYTVLQKVAESSLSHLLSGTNARVNVEYAKGVYLSDREPSISVQISFDENESKQVMAALANFATSYNQQQIHVRQPTVRKAGYEFDDGSYATVVYEIPLKKELSNVRISEIIEQSGLAGFTVTPETLTAYWVKTDGNDESNFASFKQQAIQVNQLVGKRNSRPKQTVERLYVYGEGYGARIPYEQIKGELRVKQSSDTRTPKIIAEYLTGEPVTTFKQKPITQAQAKDQELLANVFDELPINDLKNPLVKKAYKALAKSLEEQYKVLPIKVVLVDSTAEPYANSSEMRQDVSKRNRFRVYKTTPETFGPPGSDFRGHPLLQDSELTDVNGTPMLYNDLLRAVHDYFAHNLTEAEFGPKGEMAAWRNHMAMTNDPLARWALTAETRAQNAWQNFRSGVQNLTLMQRGFADQKAALPPVNFVLTGNPEVDKPMINFIGTLSPEEKLGSLKSNSKLASKVESKMPKPDTGEKVSVSEQPSGESARGEKLSLREAPDTPEFKRWFGDSKVVDNNGKPLVVYHGTPYDFVSGKSPATFNTKDFGALLGKGAYFTADLIDAEQYAGKAAYGGKPNIIPVYVSLKNPYIAESVLEKLPKQNELSAQGYDGVLLKNKDGSVKWVVAFEPTQIKSAIGNTGAYDARNPDIRYSLRDIKSEIESMPNGKQIFSAIKGATTTREEKGWAERITSFVAPRSFSQYRAQALDRYNQLSVREKNLAQENGGIERLADSNAHAAALMSDLHAGVTAQVLGVDDGIGGVPVFEKGYTTVSNLNGTVKGPMEIFKRLAAVGDPTIYQAYQFWAAAKRGKRLLGEGREQNIDANGIGFANALEGKYPMFVDIQKDWIKFNNGLVKYQIDTGVISKEMGQEWMKYADYLPFYRQLDGENTVGPKIYQSISGVKPTKKLKGSEAPIADFLETVVRNTHAAVQAGMKNVAAQRAGQLAVQVGIGERLDGPATGHDIVTALENGKKVFYRVGDDLFVDAVSSLNMPELPFISFLTAPANVLRNLVTKDPGFMLTNLMRDSVAAYVTSGANIKPMVSTMQEFTRAMRNESPEFEMLKRAGVVGGYDYSKGVQASTEHFAKQLRKRSGTQTKSEQRLKAVTGIWDFLEKGSEASDAATRIAVFKDTLKRTGNEAEALLQSLEVMNFNRKGSSALIRIVTAGIPFLNARIQGLDVLYRAGIRPIFSGTNPTEREKQIQRTFFVRAGMIMGISLMYAMAVKNDPKYEAQEEETKDNNWLIPQLGIKIPTPFEIGFLFKTMPERIYRWGFSGSDTGEEFADSMKRGLVSTFAFNPVPQAVLPIAEAIANYSTFTMRPIVGQNLLNIDPQYQVGPSTSVMAEKIGDALGVSPMKIDHIYKGYTGTMGMYLVDTLDTVFDLFSDNPRPAKRFEQMPVLKRLLIDPDAKGNVTAYYAFKHSVDEAVRTVNFLDKRLNKDAGDYQEKKLGLLDYKQYISDMDKQMNALQDESIMIRSSGMSAKEKKDALLDITRIQNEMLSDIRQIKKMAKEQ